MGIFTINDLDKGDATRNGPTSYAGGEKSGISLEQPPNVLYLYQNGLLCGSKFYSFDLEENRKLWSDMQQGNPISLFGEYTKLENLEVDVIDKSHSIYEVRDEQRVQADDRGAPSSVRNTTGVAAKACVSESKLEVVPPVVNPGEETISITIALRSFGKVTVMFPEIATVNDLYSWVRTVQDNAAVLKSGFPPTVIEPSIQTLRSLNLHNELIRHC